MSHVISPELVALGEVLIDFTQAGFSASGQALFERNAGGAPANVAVQAARLGMSAQFVGKVGADMHGDFLRRSLQERGVDVSSVAQDPDAFTTLAFVEVDPRTAERSFSFARKPGADTQLRWDELDRTILDGTRVFHFGTLSLTDEPARTATQKAVAYARAAGKLITYDPNYRAPLWKTEQAAKEQMLWGLQQADVVKISDEEVRFLWGCTPEEGADRVLALGAKLAMVTLGPEGCYLKNRNAAVRASSPKVHPVDTTGAGDIFGGSAVAQLLDTGKAPEDLTEAELLQIARFAATAASLSTETLGGIPSIPKKEAVLARM